MEASGSRGWRRQQLLIDGSISGSSLDAVERPHWIWIFSINGHLGWIKYIRRPALQVWHRAGASAVPPKVRILGWRIATNSLATKKNKFRRTIEVDSTCIICGNSEEDEFHAVVECTKSRALREAMRKEWALPPESSFRRTGPDWLQLLLSTVTEDMRARLVMLLWRCYGVIRDLKEALALFAEHKISFVWRNCNVLAHQLAAEAKQNGNLLINAGVPDRLRDQLTSE